MLHNPCPLQLHPPPPSSASQGHSRTQLPSTQPRRALRTYRQRVDPPHKELIAARSRERKGLKAKWCPGSAVSHKSWRGPPPHPPGPRSRVRPLQSCHSSQRTLGQQLLQAQGTTHTLIQTLGRAQRQPGFRVWAQGQSPFTYSLRTLPDSRIAFSKLHGEESQG